MTCELRYEGRKASGIVLDLSSTGLFVQTSALPAPGTIFHVMLEARGDTPALDLRVRVARQRRTEPRLAALVPPGLGLQILDAPSAYFDLVEKQQ
ncbi:MAG: PilZ domain-containing protein [Deltaproteobacteria bacterium]|nr:PilZ domain-containing protein [Deltaproteobacteria bacterium]